MCRSFFLSLYRSITCLIKKIASMVDLPGMKPNWLIETRVIALKRYPLTLSHSFIGVVRWSEPDQPTSCFPSQVTVHQTSRTVFFSHDKSAGTVFFSQVSDQRTGPYSLRVERWQSISKESNSFACNGYLSLIISTNQFWL